jgi:hypothetical protein
LLSKNIHIINQKYRAYDLVGNLDKEKKLLEQEKKDLETQKEQLESARRKLLSSIESTEKKT